MANGYGDIVMAGMSGAKYRFRAWPYETRFRPVGAVFFVTQRVFRNPTFRRASHDVIYIGQTSRLSGPLGTQTQLDAFEKHGANCICVYTTEDEAQRVGMVEDLAASHLPVMKT